jgi:hypothetical protein
MDNNNNVNIDPEILAVIAAENAAAEALERAISEAYGCSD